MLTMQLKAAKMTGPQRSVDLIASRLTDFREPLAAAGAYVREQTRQRYEARGFGEWPPLSESTVARKTSQGYMDPPRQLFAEGNLFESATSAHGPYSYTILEPTFIVIGVDWAEGPWQIPAVLSEGAGDRVGFDGRLPRFPRGNHAPGWGIPARPIYPPGREVINGVSRILRNWVRAPVEPLAMGGGGGVWTGASTPPLG